MAGAALQIIDQGFDEAIASIEGVERLEQSELLDSIGRYFQEDTRERIEVTKTSPDGQAWAPNRQGTSTLYDSGNLSASIDYAVSGSSVAIGSGLIYALIHQKGGEIKPKNADRLAFMVGNQLVFAMKVTIPARAYLGASAENREAVLLMIVDTIAELFQ